MTEHRPNSPTFSATDWLDRVGGPILNVALLAGLGAATGAIILQVL